MKRKRIKAFEVRVWFQININISRRGRSRGLGDYLCGIPGSVCGFHFACGIPKLEGFIFLLLICG